MKKWENEAVKKTDLYSKIMKLKDIQEELRVTRM